MTAVHSGYAPYREALRRAGVILYEMKPSAHTELARVSRRENLTGSSRSSLHAKVYMTDRRALHGGSFNLDYRSARLNTEMGVVLENEQLCEQLPEEFIHSILDVAYRIELVDDGRGSSRLVWITREGNREVRYDSEPDVGLLQRLYLRLLRILSIEEQL